jgi:glycosyltransferase involved in cell wall biosynthesis
MLDDCLDYLETRSKAENADNPGVKFTYEVIVVDDGSSDKTSEVAFRYAKKMGSAKVRVLTLTKNRGKGGAVYMVKHSTNHFIPLFHSQILCDDNFKKAKRFRKCNSQRLRKR